VKVSRRRADVWYKFALVAMTARPNTTSLALAGSGTYRYAFSSYRAWRFS
jgi:hypothetical protein